MPATLAGAQPPSGDQRCVVLQALHEGRVSARKPPHFQNSASRRVLFTWTADGRRCHVLRAEVEAFRVLTLLDQSTKAAAA
jgi:hypothetical protein